MVRLCWAIPPPPPRLICTGRPLDTTISCPGTCPTWPGEHAFLHLSTNEISPAVPLAAMRRPIAASRMAACKQSVAAERELSANEGRRNLLAACLVKWPLEAWGGGGRDAIFQVYTICKTEGTKRGGKASR